MSQPSEIEAIKLQEEKQPVVRHEEQSPLEEVKVLQNSSSIEELPPKSVDSNDFKSANEGSPPREGPPTDDILHDSDKMRSRDKMDKQERRQYPRGQQQQRRYAGGKPNVSRTYMRYQNRVGQEVINGAVDHDNFPFPTFAQVNPGAHPPGHVLTENNQILKAINMNKMQHQYIQNLQKANMTLKCKIKEISDLKVGQYDASTLRQIESMDEFNEESFDAPEEMVEEIDEDFTLAELGTIEQMTQEAQTRKKEREARSKVREKERGFYDRNSIGRKQSRQQYREKSRSQGRGQPPKKEQQQKGKWVEYDSSYYYQYQEDDHLDRYYDEVEEYYQYYGYYPEKYYGDSADLRRINSTYSKGGASDLRRLNSNYSAHSYKTAKQDYSRHAQQQEEFYYRPKRAQQGKQNSSYKKDQAKPPSVPAVKQQRSSEGQRPGHRDLRPAVFIKDLKKRSYALEEEKAQHKKRQRELVKPKKPVRSSEDPIDLLIDDPREPMTSKKGDRTPSTDLEALYHAHIRKIEAAIRERNKEELSDIIVKVKTVGQLDESYKAPDSIMKTKMKLLGVIKRGEEALIRFAMQQ